jgi:hypothetical protein
MGINKDLTEGTAFMSENDEFSVNERPTMDTPDTPTIGITSGWAKSENTATGDYPVDFKYTETRSLIKILDTEGPVANFKEHWLTEKTEGRRTYACLGAGCPLCNVLGNKPTSKHKFNIINLSVNPFMHQVMTVSSVRLYEAMQQQDSGDYGPLNKAYWTISRSGQKQLTTYQFLPVKARDLMEDFGVNEEDVLKFIKEVTPYTAEQLVQRSSLKELQDLAKELL